MAKNIKGTSKNIKNVSHIYHTYYKPTVIKIVWY